MATYSPINYAAAMPQPADLTRNILSGLELGNAFQNMQLQQQAMQAKQERAQQYQAATMAAMQNPTPQAFASLALQFPEHREAFKQGWDQLNADQQQNELRDMGTLGAALQSGRPDIAAAQLEARIAAMKKSGAATEKLDGLLEIIKTQPDKAYATVLRVASGIPGGDKLIEGWTKIGGEQRAQDKAPAELKKAEADAKGAEADATTKGVTAKYADRTALADLEKKGWDIKNIQSEIGYRKEQNRIASLNSAISRETNGLRRQELQLQLDDKKSKLEQAARDKAAEFESRINGVTDARALVREIKESPGTYWATGTTALSSLTAGTDARTAAGKIEQLQNTLAAENLDKLKGAMSDKDIAFLKNIASNLDRFQGTDRFLAELEKVDAALVRGESAVRKKYGAPPAMKPSNPAPQQVAPGVTVSGW
jgi:hypothetical protein